MKRLSVIVPVRDRAKQLERCLQSIGRQSYRPLQVVVVDNSSSDGSVVVAQSAAISMRKAGIEVKVISEPRQGATFARNAAIEHTDGNVLAFVDSDDTIRPEYAETVMAPFNSDDDVEIVFWRKNGHWPDGSQREFRFTRKASLETHVVHAVLDTMGCAVSRNLYQRTGGWNTSLPIWNDWEIGIRYLLNLKGKVARIDRVLIDKYQHADSITGSSYLSRKGRYEKSLQAAMVYAGGNAWLRTLLAYKTSVLGAHYRREGDQKSGGETLANASKMLPCRCGVPILRMIYTYTSKGLRGAALWAVPLLKICCGCRSGNRRKQ